MGVAKKLQVKADARVLVLGVPPEHRDFLDPLPPGATVATRAQGAYDVVVLFATTKADLDRRAPAAREASKPGGGLWACYPKRSSGIDTDLSRDAGWDAFTKAGLRPVSLVAIDDTWSALRFKPRADVRARKP